MILRKLALAAVCMLAVLSCGKNDPKEDKKGLSVDGIWELSSVQTKAAQVGGTSVEVYLEFATGNFTLYQKIGAGRYTQFTGTYKVGEDNSLSGSYSGGDAWGPYEASVEGTTLTLSKGSETDTYQKVDAIPEGVLQNLNL